MCADAIAAKALLTNSEPTMAAARAAASAWPVAAWSSPRAARGAQAPRCAPLRSQNWSVSSPIEEASSPWRRASSQEPHRYSACDSSRSAATARYEGPRRRKTAEIGPRSARAPSRSSSMNRAYPRPRNPSRETPSISADGSGRDDPAASASEMRPEKASPVIRLESALGTRGASSVGSRARAAQAAAAVPLPLVRLRVASWPAMSAASPPSASRSQSSYAPSRSCSAS